jgi:hypothetical protein
MSMLDEVKRICARLAPYGWAELFKLHGLDINADNLAAELARPLPGIRRDIQGFEDFAVEGTRGIEPGAPALSLLYHALASPRVEEGLGIPRLEKFPTLAELDIVENYVFAARKASLADIRAQVGGRQLAIVVFASEYRPAIHTAHRRHADMVFSRTGVSRVGTAEPLYHNRFRGFVPHVEENAFAIRVSPARFSAYLAVQSKGDKSNSLPMRFFGEKNDRRPFPPDDTLQFWQPVHKLFSGSECLTDVSDLELRFEAHHLNEKLRRIHLTLGKTTFDSGWKGEDLANKPFRFSDGLAEFSTSADFPPGVLVPVPHPALVEPATYQGQPLTYNVPPNGEMLSSSLRIPSNEDEARSAPEYVHARTRVQEDGRHEDLNLLPAVVAEVHKGLYKALHYIDFTADGWVSASCLRVETTGVSVIAAYSLVTAPNFFVSYSQRELTEWTEALPDDLRGHIWETSPAPLSDQRLAANLTIPDAPFTETDLTASALVSMFGKVSAHSTHAPAAPSQRHSSLPDHAAGVFAPGWDVSYDVTNGVKHMAAYGLGSPFPEDAKLCAALSTFWPAAAPDSTRTFTYASDGTRYFTVAPLTDVEIGQQGRLPWDGETGPRLVVDGNKRYAEFASFDHSDYVQSAMERKFTLRLTSHIAPQEFQDRVLAMALAYRSLGANTQKEKNGWIVLSFRPVEAGDPELQDAQLQAHTTLLSQSYRLELFRQEKSQSAADFRKQRVEIRELHTLFVDPNNRRILSRKDEGKWTRTQVGTLGA